MSEAPLMLAMAALGHVLTSLVQDALHRLLGHSPAGGALHRAHAGSHHTVYTEARMVSSRYDDTEISLTPLYLVPALAVVMIFLWLLPLRYVACGAFGIFISFAAHVYLHAHYHLSQSRLRRHEWFRRRQRLHAIHHRDGTKNFGLIHFCWDRLLGTFCDSQPGTRRPR
jgi:sterol desaturase/sphingolipid hydroxylase (fatty acid hydroxylase superfamily)